MVVDFTSFRDINRPSRLLKRSLVVFTVSAAVNAISDLLEIALFVRIMGGEPVTEAEVLGNDLRQSILGIVHFIIYLVTAVLFLRWTYLANWNARILGAPDLKPSPGWAVGWYFVPIANLWKPFQALRQTFKASHPDYTENWQEAPSPALLLLWWLLWIFTGYLGRIVLSAALGAETLDDLALSSRFMFLLDTLDAVLGIVVISLVSKLQEWQSEKHRRMVSTAAVNGGLEQTPVTI